MKHKLISQPDSTVVCINCGKDSLLDGDKWVNLPCESEHIDIRQGRRDKTARQNFFEELSQ